MTKPSCTKGRKRHTALDTFDLVLRVVVTAASVPEREAIAQVLSFGLPDGAKALTAVYGQASLSCYPLPLFIQPLRLGPNQPATARSHSLQPRSTFSPHYPIVKFCDNFHLVALDTELSVIVRERKKNQPNINLKNTEELHMSTENQARSLMMRHHHMVKNRQQSMLNRTATEVGMEDIHYWGHIQGKPQPSFQASYDRSNATMS